MRTLGWSELRWLNPPPARVETGDGNLEVTAARGSDFWRVTHYGFERHSGHAGLVPFGLGQSIEVEFEATLDQLYDQAGLIVIAAEDRWIKAGVEFSDGQPQVGAVVTSGMSDWSCSPVPTWAGSLVTLRASWDGGAVTIRARRGGDPWQTVRLAPFLAPDPSQVAAGIYCAAPERAGLRVRFRGLRLGGADRALHAPPTA